MEEDTPSIQTPNTWKSSNVKTRARKALEPVTFDAQETGQLQTSKIIKKEKVS